MLGDRRDAGQRPAVGARRMGGVADREDVGVAGHAQVCVDKDAADAVMVGAEPFGGRRGLDAGGPDDGAGRDPLAVADLDADPSPMSATGAPSRTSTPSSRSDCSALADRFGGKDGSSAGPASIRMTREQCGVMLRKSRDTDARASSAMAPAISTPVGPPPMTTKVSSAWRRSRVALGLGALEREQHAAADRGRVLDAS